MGTFLGVQAYGRVGISLVDWKYMKGGGKSVITVRCFALNWYVKGVPFVNKGNRKGQEP